MRPLQIDAFMRLKANGPGKPKRFTILAYSGGALSVDGFPLPVVVDLAGLETPNAIPILIDHEKSVDATLGMTDTIYNSGTALTLSGPITGQSPKSLQVLAQSAAGHAWKASIGATVLEEEEIAAGASVKVNGQTIAGPVIVARRSVLRETSVLPVGADSSTSVNLAANAAQQLRGMAAMKTFEEWLISIGLDAATLTPEAMAVLQPAYAALMATAPAPAPAPVAVAAPLLPTAAAKAIDVDIQASITEGRRLQAAEMRRVGRIHAKAFGYPNIAATAIEHGWNEDKVELEVMKAKDLAAAGTRTTSFRGAQNAPENQHQVLEAAICVARRLTNNGRRPGVVEIDKQYPDQILQAAHTQFQGRVGLQQVIMICAAQAGMPTAAGDRITQGNIRQVLAYAFPRTLEAAFSTLSLPGILSNVANKEILQGYMEEDAVWREIAQIKSSGDFKTTTSYRLLDDMSYEKLGPGGVIKHGTTGEESFTRSVDTYAKMYAITRQDIINDDLSAFDAMRSRLGMGSAMKLNDLFWATYLGNLGTIFTTGRTNYITGATTNLGTDGVGLGLGQKAWRTRTTPTADGTKRLSGTASFVLVPPELEVIADGLYGARNMPAVKVSDGNTFANKYTPIVANQLSDSSITGYSTTAWYLLGDKSKGSPVVVSFLNGQETPTVESSDADFNTLGIQFRGYHDFGCDLGDGYLNAVMSKGAA